MGSKFNGDPKQQKKPPVCHKSGPRPSGTPPEPTTINAMLIVHGFDDFGHSIDLAALLNLIKPTSPPNVYYGLVEWSAFQIFMTIVLNTTTGMYEVQLTIASIPPPGLFNAQNLAIPGRPGYPWTFPQTQITITSGSGTATCGITL